MKKKEFFLLLQSGIFFLLVADLAKILFRYDAWIGLAIIGFSAYFFGGIFYKYYSKKYHFFDAVDKKQLRTYAIVSAFVIVVIIAFVKGVILETTWKMEAVVSIMGFCAGTCISYMTDRRPKEK